MPSSPRQLCVRALLEWEKGKTFSDEILHTLLEKEPLPPTGRAFLMECFFGILRKLSRLDFLIGRLRQGNLDTHTRAVLRLGLYQIFEMRTAPHAAVNESVALAKYARGLVNAVLRRALREKAELETELAQAPAAIRTSHPAFLLEKWAQQFGPEATAELATWDNLPAEVYVRANGLKTTAAELRSRHPEAEPVPFHPKALKVRQLPPEWLTAGLCYVQDPSTLMACDLLAPQPGETVLDACAAPGGKTTYLAELMQNQGKLVATDLYASRLQRLRENVQRLGCTVATVMENDTMMENNALPAGSFDRILLDTPCSNTGVLRRRVDVRWRLTEEDFLRLPVHQLAMVRRCVQLLKPGGILVYSTCSLEQEENDAVAARAAALPGLQFLESRRTQPFVDGVDGAFAAKFMRAP